jgi:hypothetical protein
MPLNWNIEKVADWQQLSQNPEQLQITDTLVWATMAIGMNKITADNYNEFYARLYLSQKLDGDVTVTKADVKRRIGLTTNASTLTRKQFTDKKIQLFYRIMLDK